MRIGRKAGLASLFIAGLTISGASAAPAPAARASGPASIPASNLPPAAPAISPEYRIHAGDTLNIVVYGEVPLTQQNVKVAQGGTINYPLVGEVRVGGKTQAEASDAIRLALSKYIKHPNVSVAVAQESPVSVTVIGNVKTAGKYALSAQSRLLDAIGAAGGIAAVDGDLPLARVGQADGTIHEYSLQKLMAKGELANNVILGDSTTIYVEGPQLMNIQVVGAVDHPGDVGVHEGDRLTQAIARAGTSASRADLNKVIVRRTLPGGQFDTKTVDVYNALKSNDPARDFVLQKGDLVYVPALPGNGQTNNVDRVGGIAGLLRTLIFRF